MRHVVWPVGPRSIHTLLWNHMSLHRYERISRRQTQEYLVCLGSDRSTWAAQKTPWELAGPESNRDSGRAPSQCCPSRFPHVRAAWSFSDFCPHPQSLPNIPRGTANSCAQIQVEHCPNMLQDPLILSPGCTWAQSAAHLHLLC